MRIVRAFFLAVAVTVAVTGFALTHEGGDVRSAAAQGDAGAQFILGYMYTVGQKTSPDLGRAAMWYEEAASRGHPGAMNNLAVLLASGEGVARDSFRATELFRAAAREGLAEAHANLGESYRTGAGVVRDPARGTSMIRMASLSVPPPGYEERLRSGWIEVRPDTERGLGFMIRRISESFDPSAAHPWIATCNGFIHRDACP